MCWPYPAWEMKLRPLPAEETEGVMYYDPAATGERIQNLRKDREVTQEQLAIDLNISDRYMRNLEKGEKVPSVDLFVELRERFGSSLDYIVLGVSASQREQELQNQLQMLRKELKEMQRRILVMLEMLGECQRRRRCGRCSPRCKRRNPDRAHQGNGCRNHRLGKNAKSRNSCCSCRIAEAKAGTSAPKSRNIFFKTNAF